MTPSQRYRYGKGGNKAAALDDCLIAAVEEHDNETIIETTANHVYFYAEINSSNCLKLVKELREIDQKLIKERLERNLPEEFPNTPIWLHINSFGGEVFSGFSVVDQLPQLTSPVYSIVEGAVASAATLLSMSCKKRHMQSSAYMLIHQLSGMNWGTYQQMEDEFELSSMIMKQLVDFYVAYSNMDRKSIEEMMQRDKWLPAQQCLDLGFIDEIL